jgi:hypothetical protein
MKEQVLIICGGMTVDRKDFYTKILDNFKIN